MLLTKRRTKVVYCIAVKVGFRESQFRIVIVVTASRRLGGFGLVTTQQLKTTHTHTKWDDLCIQLHLYNTHTLKPIYYNFKEWLMD